MTDYSDELRNSLEMALCDPVAFDELVADGIAAAQNDGCIAYDVAAVIPVTVDNTYVGGSYPIVIPAHTFVQGFIIVGAVPAGTSGGTTKTVDYAMGTVAMLAADITWAQATDIDIMIASGAKTAASVHGDVALDNAAGYFADVPFGKYFAADTTVNFNIRAKSTTAWSAGTITCAFKIYAIVSKLS